MKQETLEVLFDHSSSVKYLTREPSELFPRGRSMVNNFVSTATSKSIKPDYINGLFKDIHGKNTKKHYVSLWWKKIFTLTSLLANLLSIGLYLYSHESVSNLTIVLVEACINTYFLVEYAVTLWNAPDRLAAATRWNNLIDLLSIVGGFTTLLKLTETNLAFLRVIKIVRVSRVFRLLKYITEIKAKGDSSKHVYYNYSKKTVILLKFSLNLIAFYFIFTGILGSLMERWKTEMGVLHLIYIVVMKLSTVGAAGVQPLEPVYVVGISLFIMFFLGFGARLYVDLGSLRETKHVELRRAYNLTNHLIITGFFELDRMFDFIEHLIKVNSAHLPILLVVHDTQAEIVDRIKESWLAGRVELLIVDCFNYSFYKMAKLQRAHSIFLLNHIPPWQHQSPFIDLLTEIHSYPSLRKKSYFANLNPLTKKFFRPENGIHVDYLHFVSSFTARTAVHPGFHSLIKHLSADKLHIIELPSKFINLKFSVVAKFVLREANKLLRKHVPLFIGLLDTNKKGEIEYIEFNPKDTVLMGQMGIFIADSLEDLEELLETVRLTDFASLTEPSKNLVQFSSINNQYLLSEDVVLNRKTNLIRGEIVSLASFEVKLAGHTVIFAEDDSYIQVLHKLKHNCPFETVVVVADFSEKRVKSVKTYPDVFFLSTDCNHWETLNQKTRLLLSKRVIILRTDCLGSVLTEYCATIRKLTVKLSSKYDSDTYPFSNSRLLVEGNFVDKVFAFSFRDKLQALVLFSLLEVDFKDQERENTRTFDTIKLRNKEGLSYSEVVDDLLRKGAICLGIKNKRRFSSETYSVNPALDSFVREDAEILVMGSFELSENDLKRGETTMSIEKKVQECRKETREEKIVKSARKLKQIKQSLKEVLSRLSCQ